MNGVLCNTCSSCIVNRPDLRRPYPHHQKLSDLQAAVKEGCYICRTIDIQRVRALSLGQILKFPLEAWFCHPGGCPEDWIKISIEEVHDEVVHFRELSDLEESNSSKSREVAILEPGYSKVKFKDLHPDDERGAVFLFGFTLIPATATISRNIGQWTPSPHLDSRKLWTLVKRWLQCCIEDHNECKAPTDESPLAPDWLPTRLIDVRLALTENSISLVNGRDLLQPIQYGTVSHCWGKSKTLKLVTSNLEALKEGLPIGSLPFSYRDAILAACRLGIKYLWIDSLCILQDSAQDWRHEANLMGSVYRRSYLNIALAGATDNSESCFRLRSEAEIRPARIKVNWDRKDTKAVYVIHSSIYNDANESELVSRAWVQQEVYLAPRVLYLANEQIWFECKEGLACESFPGWFPPDWHGNLQQKELKTILNKANAHLIWNRIAENYSACGLTFPSDKMIAIAGLASLFRRLLDDEYIAGIWRSQLASGLIWISGEYRECSRPAEYQVPTWSWLSVDGDVTLPVDPLAAGDANNDAMFTVEEIIIALEDENNPTGRIKDAQITVSGALHPVLLCTDFRMAKFDEEMKVPQMIETSEDIVSYVEERQLSSSAFWTPDVWAECKDVARMHSDDVISGQATLPEYRVSMEKMVTYCFPVSTVYQDDEHCCYGLVLQKVEGQQQVFKRIGGFEAIGKGEIAKFRTDERCLFTLV